MNSLFWRRKKKKPKEEAEEVDEVIEAEVAEAAKEIAEEEKAEEAEEAEIKPKRTVIKNPIEAFFQRLAQILDDPSVEEKTGGISSTRIQLMVGGIPILLSKEGVKPFILSKTRSTQVDVFIRMSEKAAAQLAATESITDFSKLYRELVTERDAVTYISIKFHTPLEELRQRGYFRANILRTLIDA